jgi:hypothetical protein
MTNGNRIFAALRVQRFVVGLLLVPLLVLNLVVSSIASSHAAEARALDDFLTQSRCLSESEPMAPAKAPAHPAKERPCPSCTTACATGCCAGQALSDAKMAIGAPLMMAGLDMGDRQSAQQANPRLFRPAARAHAPPYIRHYQSIAA